jgi:hypothetical protein
MKEEILTDILLRQYLLGKLNEEERQGIDKLFITDTRARDRVLAAEQELIEDYLEDSLTKEDKQIFLSHYAQTPEQRRQLRIDKSIKDWAVKETQSGPVSSSSWSRFLEPLRLRPAFIIAIATAFLVAILVGYIWLNRAMEYRAVQREVAQLNTPASLNQSPPQMVSLSLTPVTVRSGETQNQLAKRVDSRLVELRLLAIDEGKYQTYRVVVYHVGAKEPITTVDVNAEKSDTIRFRLPARILANGSYRIELSGITSDGSRSPTEEYVFTVTS